VVIQKLISINSYFRVNMGNETKSDKIEDPKSVNLFNLTSL